VVIKRLVLYLRLLSEMELGEGDTYISSQELGTKAGVSPAQVRKDLASFGEFGKQGVGYEIGYLREELRGILNLNRQLSVAIIGVGELGTALARYISRRAAREKRYPFRIVAGFDVDPEKIGRVIEPGVQIRSPEDMAEFVVKEPLDIAVITVPAAVAQQAADVCVKAGVRAILNFAPAKLFVPPGVRVHYSDVSLELQQLAYYLS
jgi:redox-sensing transcriptional repressor